MLRYTGLNIYIIVIATFLVSYNLHANTANNPILIISSYNPDSQNTAINISEFIEEYKALGGKSHVIIENMNCRSFPESLFWQKRLEMIVTKYANKKPGIIMLLGQEAWASYLSQNDTLFNDIPVICAMVSSTGINLPAQGVESLENWMPESVDFLLSSPKPAIKGGFIYEYDIEDNIKLIKKLYPSTRNIAFISDNTYGGVSLQALVRKEMQKFPELNLILLDGRQNTIYTIMEEIRTLPENTVGLMGTWRVDKNDGYFMRNATYSMMEANPDLPFFSLSTIGFGYWAIGGIMPAYRNFGKDMAQQAIKIEKKPDAVGNGIIHVGHKLRIDYQKFEKLNLDFSLLPGDTIFINKTTSFYEQYKMEIWFIIILVLILVVTLMIVVYSYIRTKQLKDELIISGRELMIAKERAEESNNLKSTFIANMSHEIRTPLNSIVGFANVIAMGENSKEDQQAFYEIVQTNADLLLRLINDILDISRLETGKVNFTFEQCDIISIAKQALTTIDYSKKSTNQFIFNSEVQNYDLETDPQRLQQVIINLLSNAVKFTVDGTISLDVKIDTKMNYAVFSVTDTGTGIPLEKQSLVFERFEKLNEHKQGTGLGLSISKLIVNKWGGNIWVDPEYVGGARFIFTHPLKIEIS